MYASPDEIGVAQSLGFLMIGISSTSLTDVERKQLMHPAVAGVVLFSRNYESPDQLRSLTRSIHALRHPRLLVAVDHEGGRVQRFKTQGFTCLPTMKSLGERYDQNAQDSLHLAYSLGWILAAELLACGVDFSFAPVVDLDYGSSHVIGDRALHHNPHVVSLLAEQLMQGMQSAGMSAVAKHFPGHGFVVPDTHVQMAEDTRSLAALMGADIQPFKHLIQHYCGAIMAAHVIYPSVDSLPAGLSVVWLQQWLREHCGFTGAIISDDLGMKAVASIASGGELAHRFRQAGCDLVLLCNDEQQINSALSDHRKYEADPLQESRLIRLHGKPKHPVSSLTALHKTAQWLSVMKHLARSGLVKREGEDYFS